MGRLELGRKNKMLNKIRAQVLGWWSARFSSNLQVRALQTQVARYDVTPIAGHFDARWLEPVESAPVWMSRAERLLMFTLAFTLRPQHYLEIGTFQGGSALVVASALDALQSPGRMYLVDPEPKISAEHWQRLSHRAERFEGYSPAILQEVAARAGAPFDLVLIDGDHTYAGARRDAVGVLPFVARGGYVLFHDSFFPEVRQAIDEWIDEHPGRLVDFGLMTREITVQQSEDGRRVEWGGLRLVYVV
jgi:predicted O-methyltransferase YrrM